MEAGGMEPIIGPVQPGWAPNILDHLCSDEDDMNWAEAKARQQLGLEIERSLELRQWLPRTKRQATMMTITIDDDQDDNQDDNKDDNRMAMETNDAEADAADDNRMAMTTDDAEADAADDNEEATAHLKTYPNAKIRDMLMRVQAMRAALAARAET